MSASSKDQEIEELKQKLKVAEEERDRERSQRQWEKRRADDAEEERHRLVGEIAQLSSQLAGSERVEWIQQAQSRRTPSPEPIPQNQATLSPILPIPQEVVYDGEIFKHISEDNNYATIIFDPEIKSGIVRAEVLNISKLQAIGIADESVRYRRGDQPQAKGWGKIAGYFSNGWIGHVGELGVWGNESFEGTNIRLTLEFNMESNPRSLTFFYNGIEQPNYVVKIPNTVRIWTFIRFEGGSFKITKFERVSTPKAKHLRGSKALEWGKQWAVGGHHRSILQIDDSDFELDFDFQDRDD